PVVRGSWPISPRPWATTSASSSPLLARATRTSSPAASASRGRFRRTARTTTPPRPTSTSSPVPMPWPRSPRPATSPSSTLPTSRPKACRPRCSRRGLKPASAICWCHTSTTRPRRSTTRSPRRSRICSAGRPTHSSSSRRSRPSTPRPLVDHEPVMAVPRTTPRPPAEQASARPGGRGRPGEPRRVAYLYILPAVTVFALFVLYPLIRSGVFSLYDWDGLGTAEWAGLANYQAVFTEPALRGAFVHALVLIVFYAIIPV